MARVLVVDEDAAMRGNLTRLVTREGHEAVAASNGLEALALVDGGGFDAAFIDLVTPNVDGLALMRRLAADRSRVRIVAMSAFKDMIDAPDGKLGPVLFLTKPFALEEARLALGLALGRTGEERSS